jgi:DNA-binding NarL/FixJ family response regulator
MAGTTGVTAQADNSRQPIRLAIVDDHPVLRDGMAALLSKQEGLEVVATGETVDDAVALLSTPGIDVLILDIRLGTQSGLTALGQGGAERPQVVVLTAYGYPQYAEAAMRLGAAGFALKNGPIADLVATIRTAAAGGVSFSVRPANGVALSSRELDVVRLVVEGRSNDEIAAALTISPKTVESHLRRIFERLVVASRTELATRAIREGWLDVPAGERGSV